MRLKRFLKDPRGECKTGAYTRSVAASAQQYRPIHSYEEITPWLPTLMTQLLLSNTEKQEFIVTNEIVHSTSALRRNPGYPPASTVHTPNWEMRGRNQPRCFQRYQRQSEWEWQQGETPPEHLHGFISGFGAQGMGGQATLPLNLPWSPSIRAGLCEFKIASLGWQQGQKEERKASMWWPGDKVEGNTEK